MSQDHKVVFFNHKKIHSATLTDRDRIIFAYHYFTEGQDSEAKKLLTAVQTWYYEVGLYKDLARALLCHATLRTTGNLVHQKESEFYLVVYRLTKHILEHNVMFRGSGHFSVLKDQLFKDFM